jgi:hypothetical protein
MELDEDAGTDIQFTGLILGVSGAADITAPALEFGAQLFLRETCGIPQSA